MHGVPSATSPNPRGPSGAQSVKQIHHHVIEVMQEVLYIFVYNPIIFVLACDK